MSQQYGCLCGMKRKLLFLCIICFLIKGTVYIRLYFIFIELRCPPNMNQSSMKISCTNDMLNLLLSHVYPCVVQAFVNPLIITILQVVSACCCSVLHFIYQHVVTTKYFFLQDTRSPKRCRKRSVGFVWRTLQTNESLCWQILEVYPSANICLTVTVQVQHFPPTKVLILDLFLRSVFK